MANTYSLLLQAQINAASIQEQLTAMAGKYTLAINAAISSVQQATTTAVPGGGVGGVGGISPISTTAAENVTKFKDALQTLNPVATVTNNLTGQMMKANDAQVTGLGEVSKRTIALTKNLEGFSDSTRVANVATKSWIGDLQNAFEKIMLWAVATGIVYGALRALKEGVQYIKDLNVEMTNIQIVTGFATSQINDLALSYNKLAGQLGATTIEVAQGTLEWFRQGKTIEEANKLVTQSIMMSKLANMESAQATQYLTSILNGFKISAEDATSVLDRLVALDNSYATSVSELATAMQYSSAVAQQAGVTFNELASFITVISSVTRMSAETIGQSLKTMLTRMEQIKIGKMFEDDTISINQVAESLHAVGIEMMLNADTFRPMGDVLNDLGLKWDTLTQKQQNAIAGTVAGIRQVPQFLTLMQNWNQVIEAQGIELDSTGLAAQRYTIYQDNVQAAMNRSTTAWQGFWQVTTQSDQIKWFYDLSAVVGNFLAEIGGLPPILVLITGLLIAFNGPAVSAAISGLIFKIATLIGTINTLGISAAIASGGWTLIIGAIVAVLAIGVMAWNKYHKSATEALDEINKKIEEYKSNLDTLKTGVERLRDIGNEYETLRIKAEKLGGATKLSSDEQKRFIELQNIIHGILPQVSGDYDDMGNYILDAGIALSTLIDLQKEEIRVMREKLQLEALIGTGTKVKALQDAQKAQENANKAVESYNKIISDKDYWLKQGAIGAGIYADAVSKVDAAEKTASDAAYVTKDAIKALRIDYLLYTDAQKEEAIQLYNNLGLTQKEIDTITELTPVLDTATKHVKLLARSLEDVSDAIAKWKEISEVFESVKAIVLKARLDELLKQYEEGIIGLVEYTKSTRDAGKYADIYTEKILDNLKALRLTDEQIKALGKNSEFIRTFYDNLTNAVDKLTSTFLANDNMVRQVTEDYAKNGEITIQQANQMIDAGYAEALMIDVKTGKIAINVAILHDLVVANAQVAVSEAQLAWASAYAINRLSNETKALWAKWQALKAIADLIQKTPTALSIPTIPSVGAGGAGESAVDRLRDLQSMIVSMIRQQREEEKDALREQLEHYTEIINAQKEKLKLIKDELDYRDELADKEKDVSKIQIELDALALDNSEEAKARRLQLQEDLAGETTDLARFQRDKQYDDAQSALDKELDTYKEDIQAQIDVIDEYLSRPGQILSDAMQMISDKSDTLYQNLIAWNKEYGTGIDEDVTAAWDKAATAAQNYSNVVAGIPDISSIPVSSGGGGGTTTVHPISSGGLITGGISGQDSIHTLLTPGEFVLKKSAVDALGVSALNKMNTGIMGGIPSINNTSNNNPILHFEMPIQLYGNLDKTVLPDIEKIVDKAFDKMNLTLLKRGYKRTAEVYTI